MSSDVNVRCCDKHGEDYVQYGTAKYCQSCVLELAEAYLPIFRETFIRVVCLVEDDKGRAVLDAATKLGGEEKLCRRLSTYFALNVFLLGSDQLKAGSDTLLVEELLVRLSDKLKAS